LRDAYVETNTDLGNPAWLAVQSRNSTAPLVTSVVTSGGITSTITTRPTSTTSTRTSGAAGRMKGFVGAGLVGVIAVMEMGVLF
jgi:hypothetical protein